MQATYHLVAVLWGPSRMGFCLHPRSRDAYGIAAKMGEEES
jgi:hypothetical protein